MANPSNLYAEKIYSEHPLVLWALDDKADYASLITEAQRDISDGWSITNGTVGTYSNNLSEPFNDSTVSVINATIPTSATEVITLISPELANFSDMSTVLGNLSTGMYFYSQGAFLRNVWIGFEYTDTTTSTIVQKLEKFETDISGAWSFVSGTFDLPNENTTARIVIKFEVIDGGGSASDYRFYINGISFGQWAEEFQTSSLGTVTENFPSNISPQLLNKVIPAAAYGVAENNAYYLVANNALLARNTSIPLVYGASGVTRLTPNANNTPSLIVPGKGFLNELGRYKDYTVEFWARINSDAITPKRIFGPLNSLDGLYVEAGFLTLVIGKSFKSHFIGEWFRPMLIQIRVSQESASLVLNGEEVISFAINAKNLTLPSATDNAGRSKDWLGFYAYEDVTPIEIDCIAIYSYQVPVTVAKRRWVYGQGVLSPEGINSAYGGTTAFVDYPFADYTANYSYPDFANWQQATFDNLEASRVSLQTPRYSLPEVYLGTKTIQNLYDDCFLIQDKPYNFITFRPNSSWNAIPAYLHFPSFNVLTDQIHSIYGVFEILEIDETDQILFKVYNSLTGDSFSIRKHASHIDYYLTYNGVEEEFYSIGSYNINEPISIGVDIPKMIDRFGGNLAAFFGNQNGLKIYVGGDETGTMTFEGLIYNVGMSTNFNVQQIADHFNENGAAIPDSAPELLDHIASYSLLPSEAYGTLFLDIGASGYWEDYMPLSYFAKYITDTSGDTFYDLDFLQFNIGYPSPSKLLEKESTVELFTYNDLKNQFESPYQRTYAQLDNSLITGWNDYQDMAQKSVKYYEYDTTGASIKSYITFQYLENGANLSQANFTRLEPADESRIIDIDQHALWQSTKFEVVDNTLIYPSKSIDFNELAIVYHLEFNIRGIITKPIALKRLSISSQALSENSFNPVGTRFGVDLFPYKRSGFYYDYKSKNPFSIYKGSTPYLYMTRTSGIEVRGSFDPLVDRGISMPINKTVADKYSVSAIQLWYRNDNDAFTATPTQMFDIRHKDDVYKFYTVATNNSGTRAKIFALSERTGLEVNGISYFWNGVMVKDPILTSKEWGVLGIGFASALNFDLFLGAIDLNGPGIFNNISYYQANAVQQLQSKISRPWLKVMTEGLLDLQWQYWLDNYKWGGVLVISASDAYGVSPSDIYSTYIGTNKIVIDDGEGMTFDADKIKIFDDIEWYTSVVKAV